jgi:hypothetical protein
MSKLRLTTIANQGDTKEVPSETVIAGSAKAWVNFNGTGTVAIRDSFNVDSITDNGTGDYTVNFTNDMPNANYSYSAVIAEASVVLRGAAILSTPTVGSINIGTLSSVGADDVEFISVSVFCNYS